MFVKDSNPPGSPQLAKGFHVFVLVCAVFGNLVPVKAGQFRKLVDFDITNGASPQATLVTSSNVLYGTTYVGGTNDNCLDDATGAGTIFRVNADGTGFTNIYEFSANCGPHYSNSDGAFPFGRLLLSSNVLYGTTVVGGAGGYGTIFSVKTDGTSFTNLHNFSMSLNDGWNAWGDLVLSSNTLYGVTDSGGEYTDPGYGYNGTIFKINTDGSGFSLLHSFTAFSDDPYVNIDGARPRGGLVLSSNFLYGTTFSGGYGQGGGGGNGCGVIFKIRTDGANFQVLHYFSDAFSIYGFTNTDGANPLGRLTCCGNVLYGTTTMGGTYGGGTLFRINTDGTGFTNLFNFNPWENTGEPLGELVLSGNTFYGVAGGDRVFSIQTDGTGFNSLHYFDPSSPAPEGRYLEAGLAMHGQTLFGTASGGGDFGAGTLFAIEPSRPFISSIVLNTNHDSVTITTTGDPTFTYNMLSTTNLLSPITNWMTISTNIVGPGGTWDVTDFSITNMVYVCLTNLVYDGGGGGILPPPPGFTNNIIGTNIWCGWVREPTRFYRAAIVP